nr:hypothetical protein [uncultured Desulfobacter sp.]
MINFFSSPILTSCIIYGNHVDIQSHEIFNENASIPEIQYSDIKGSGGSTAWGHCTGYGRRQ